MEYRAGSVVANGELLLPQGEGPFPTLILFPYWRGKDQVGKEYGQKIVSTYKWAVFLADYYGEGKVAHTQEEAASLAGPLFADRQELRQRVKGAFDAARAEKKVDPKRIGAIGFCFGGLAAIELFKQGLPIKGIAALHTILGNKMGDIEAKQLPMAKDISTSLLVMNGYLDPLVSTEDRLSFEKEMKEAGVDWQLHLFGKASHAFTNPQNKDPATGLLYDETADKRSFEMLGSFFREFF